MEVVQRAYKPNFQKEKNGLIELEALVMCSNGWVIEGKGAVQRFWLEVQLVGWVLFERVPETCACVKEHPEEGKWIATALHPGPCPDPDQAISLSGVLWTRRAALEAHQSICAYQQAVSRLP